MTASATLEWPQPMRSAYSSSEYCASWMRRSASAATDAPVIQSRDRSAKRPVSAGSWSGMYASERPSSSIRKPTVGPGWTTSSAVTDAPSTVHRSCGTSWKVTWAGTSRRSIGKSGGEKERRIRRCRLDTGEGGPQTSTVTFGSQSGAKNRSPSRWSRCKCVSSRCSCRPPRCTNSRPSALTPVRAWRTGVVPLSRHTSTHDVFPPYSTVSGPGAGTDPRQPQIFRRTGPTSLAPEDRHDADELVRLREERKGGDGDVTVDAVAARDTELTVRGAALVERDARRPLLRWQRRRVGRPWGEAGRPLVERHLPHLGERAPDHLLRRLVVEDELALGVRDQHRRCEVRRDLPGEDQDQVLRALLDHGASVRRGALAFASVFPRLDASTRRRRHVRPHRHVREHRSRRRREADGPRRPDAAVLGAARRGRSL